MKKIKYFEFPLCNRVLSTFICEIFCILRWYFLHFEEKIFHQIIFILVMYLIIRWKPMMMIKSLHVCMFSKTIQSTILCKVIVNGSSNITLYINNLVTLTHKTENGWLMNVSIIEIQDIISMDLHFNRHWILVTLKHVTLLI